MNAYFDITLVDNPEVACAVLFGAVYDRVHREIVGLNLVGRIAVDFPDASKTSAAAHVGTVLRLWAVSNDLQALFSASLGWRGLQGRFQCGEIVHVGRGAKRERWVRTQPHSFTPAGIEKLVRRREKRLPKNKIDGDQLRLDLQQKLQDSQNWQQTMARTHHVHVSSASSSKKFLLFLKRDKTIDCLDFDGLNAYGLGIALAI